MKPFSKRYRDLIDRLVELYEAEHGDCDQNTCGMQVAFRHGYGLWSVYLFDRCGAASDEFNELFAKLPARFNADAERERKAFVKEVEHTDCPHCNAVIWCPDEVTNHGKVFCNSCAEEHEAAS